MEHESAIIQGALHTFVRPRLVVSACLGERACRYDGSALRDAVLDRLAPFVEMIPVCPEEEIGLGTPRPPLRLVQIGGAAHMVQPDSGDDVTGAMHRFSERFLHGLRGAHAVDGFVLKSRSPSCGVENVRVHSTPLRGASATRGAGLFAAAAGAAFPRAAMEEEGRLRNYMVRDHFLTRIFALARLRELGRAPSMGRLVDFQARQKLLLMACSRRQLDACGRLVANPQRRPARAVCQDYAEEFAAAFARPPRHVSNINVLEHALGYVTREITAAERRHFLALLDRYRRGRIPLASPVSVMRSWIVRFGTSYLAQQTYFEPYPEEMVDLLDSGKGRPID